jgi:hypothetical protein
MKTLRRNGLRSTYGRLLPKGRKKGQQALSPGHRPGYKGTGKFALKGQKLYLVHDAFALSGRWLRTAPTQGAALGWELTGLSGRPFGSKRQSRAQAVFE